jgi:CheY-like chemotaxis protein
LPLLTVRLNPATENLVLFSNSRERPVKKAKKEQTLFGLKILVVDDQSDALNLIEAILTQVGGLVQTASSAAEAYKLLQSFHPDILISDIGMPGEDGYALLQRIRKLEEEKGGATPAVALSAYAREEDQERSLEAGFQLHMTKPIQGQVLVDSILKVANASNH